MKILQITPERMKINSQVPYDSRADYMGDLLFHGLRELYGEDVIDYPRKDHMYKGYEHGSKLWGKGFSYCGLLDDIPVDRDINKISFDLQDNKYDLVILTSHNTVDHYPDIFYGYLSELRKISSTVKIAVINGKDRPEVYDKVWGYTPYHFQREIPDGLDDRLIPINFCIPACKVLDKVPPKKKMLAGIVPANHDHPNRKTHVFQTEEEYYYEYQQSYFALTTCKAGFDCMRHIEILANGCIPLFGDIRDCPERTLTMLPKTLFNIIMEDFCSVDYFNKNTIDLEHNYIVDSIPRYKYMELAEGLLDYTREFLTTTSLAKYVLENCKCL